MKKTICFVFLAVVLLAATAFADATIIKVKVTTANVRQQPDATSPVISRAAQGTFFEVIKKVGNWYEIAVADATGKTVTGFLNADVVDEVGGAAAAAPAKPRGAASAPTYAAPRAATGPSAGKFLVMLGPVLSNMSISPAIDPEFKKASRFGLAAGAGYELPLGQNLYATGAAIFSTGGANFSWSGEGTTSKWSYIGNALALRFGIKYTFNGPFVAAGPYFGFLMSPKLTWSYTDASGSNSGEETIDTAEINTFLFGLVVGGGYDFDFGGMKFFVQISYNLGLSNMAKNAEGGESSAKPNSINFIFGVRL